MDKIEYIISETEEHFSGREIIIYGYCDRSNNLRKKLESLNYHVAFYVDGSEQKQMKKDVLDPGVLKNYAEKYYVVIPLSGTDEIPVKLHELGYSENDYCYLGDLKYSVISETEDYFEDSYGNVIVGGCDHAKIHFNGFGSRVVVGKNFRCGNEFEVKLRDNSVVKIGDSCFMDCKLTIFDDSLFECGDHCRFEKNGLIYMISSDIIIGNGFTVESGYSFHALKYSAIRIGNDCMFSYNVALRTNDGHSIFNIKTGENINSTEKICKERTITIGDHVWLSTNSIVLYNTNIAAGSIIGAASLVKTKIPNNCIAAGVPARIIRKDISWCRTNYAESISECNELYVNDTDECEERII